MGGVKGKEWWEREVDGAKRKHKCACTLDNVLRHFAPSTHTQPHTCRASALSTSPPTSRSSCSYASSSSTSFSRASSSWARTSASWRSGDRDDSSLPASLASASNRVRASL